ncbi:MAG: hypothetical protein LBO04_00085 [Spirochaetaceae bacterium]|jgi:hypothetical protein|nr:hypothetical protein [Spirochaetaceae bacterium]
MNEYVLGNVAASLDIMWKGMAGLFIVCGGLAVVLTVIAKIVGPRK